jgi:4-amino-4-deoxy-L-arabinose transferase-like glycosyltransferase
LKKSENRIKEEYISANPLAKFRVFLQVRTTQEKAFILIYLAVLVTILLIRLRLLSTPFERDEGEYAYIGQTLLHGGSLFRDAFTMKLPGTSMMYALWMLLFGETIEAVHLGLLLTNFITALLIWRLVKKWGGSTINGITASIIFLMLSISQSALGFAAHATHFVVLYCLIALIILENAMQRNSLPRYFAAGLFFGMSLAMKQQGALFLLLPIIFIIEKKKAEQYSWLKVTPMLIVLFIGAFVPFALLAVYLSAIGTFDKFYFWVLQYSSAYGGRVDPIVGSLIFLNSLGVLIERTPLFWLLSISGIIYAFAFIKNKYAQRSLLFLGVGILVISPGFYFREHYFVAVFPALAMLGSLVVDYMQKKFSNQGWQRFGSAIIVCILLLLSFAVEAPYYFLNSPEKVVEKTYGKLNVFTTSKMISEYIKANTTPSDKIQVLGSEPQIYFFSNRRSASGHIYMYGLMENQEYARSMQNELAQDIVNEKPKFIVFSLEKSSWMLSPESDMWLWDWYKSYGAEHYDIAGLGVLDKDSLTQFIWGDAVKKNTAAPVVIISERRD